MRVLPFPVLLVLLVLAAPLRAAPPVAAPMAPPARLGLCAACHGSNGIATLPGVPNLAGQRLDYLRQALADYRSGRRDVAPMRAATGPLSTRELDQLAAWYASRPPCAPAAKR
ncbi:MAG: c-type cytochrome [Xanthomonadaceae bacterium]|nr:c-type cytochrome [Xanthomonadaceae bacterium]MDE2246602.1 c-type cytochrome [Xanthomonadaceae bacterium]